MSLVLSIITPEGKKADIPCDSVTLRAKDNEKGEGGGSIGIRRGHMPALIALETPSRAVARSSSGDRIFSVRGGFASVADDVVTVMTEGAEEIRD